MKKEIIPKRLLKRLAKNKIKEDNDSFVNKETDEYEMISGLGREQEVVPDVGRNHSASAENKSHFRSHGCGICFACYHFSMRSSLHGPAMSPLESHC